MCKGCLVSEKEQSLWKLLLGEHNIGERSKEKTQSNIIRWIKIYVWFMCNLAVVLLKFQHQKGFVSIPKRKRRQPAWFVHNMFQGQKWADLLLGTFCAHLSTLILPVWEQNLMLIWGGRVAVLKMGCLKFFSRDLYDVLLFPQGFEGTVFSWKNWFGRVIRACSFLTVLFSWWSLMGSVSFLHVFRCGREIVVALP